ncbi:MAG: hypothetical protein ACHQK8_07300 [Bacteroidia bacterium]
MKIAITILRIIFGLLFLAIGLFHFYNMNEMSMFFPLPFGGKIYVMAVGTLVGISGVAIIINRYVKISLLTISCILAITGFFLLWALFHFKIQDPIMKILGFSCLTEIGIAVVVLLVVAVVKVKK